MRDGAKLALAALAAVCLLALSCYAEKGQCDELMSRTQTRSDTLTVLAARPFGSSPTCQLIYRITPFR